MANQYNNKIVLGNETLIDLTGDDVTENDVIQGKKFHLGSGAPGTGSLGNATQSSAGLMSAEDKTKLDGMNNVGTLSYTVVKIYT